MRRGIRATIAAAATLATLAFAGSALAANTGSIAVWHSPMTLGASSSTTIHVSIPKSTDPLARLAIYAPSGYSANLSQAPGANIGSVTATAFSYDTQLTLPLEGTVNTDSPAAHTADACSPGTHAAIWILNLSVSGQTLQVPMYVDPTAGAEAALGAYKLVICLPPPDVPAGTPGRAAFGAQLLDAQFTVNGIFSTPSGGGLVRWESLFTPYNPGKGTPNAAGTWESRAFVPLPVSLSLKASYTKKNRNYSVGGKLSEGGLPVSGVTVSVLSGSSPTKLVAGRTGTTTSAGAWSAKGKFGARPKKPVYFKATAAVKERDYTATGCQSPLAPTIAPAGCLSATLPPWTATSAVAKIKP
ncbi:MAG TPA: hypothetical protein VGN27_13520 [Gaiellaceae bacterium]|jgi:hypothetical protein|nr:hypothetical protein [Gaiellaceae bacterium]